MSMPFTPPRQVTIDGAASFAGTTPQAIRRYHEIGLLPEPVSSGDDRCYGYDEVIQLLWIRRMVDAGFSENEMRDAFPGTTPGADDDRDAVVSRKGLLSDVVSRRLDGVPEGSLRLTDLDTVLVIERIFGPLGAAVHAGRYIALATHPDLRDHSDRVEAAEEALDDTIAADDPRVAQVAAERHAVELALNAAIEESGQAQEDDALFDSWDALHHAADDGDGEACRSAGEHGTLSIGEAMRLMPYDYSPARLRCMELAQEIAMHESPAP